MSFRKRRDDERGVVAIVTAIITCFVMIPVAALAVDLGVQRVARADMQSTADVVALDLARHLDGSTTRMQWESKTPSLQDRAEASADQNNSAAGAKADVQAELGMLDEATGVFTALPNTSTEIPNAVRVTASTSVSFGFSPGSGGAVRSAVAQARTSACFQLGSFVGALDPSASTLFKDLLTPLLGSSTLQAAGYNGLASTRLNLLDIVQSQYIGVGTVNELLLMDDLTVGDLYRASASVLRGEGKIAQAEVFDAAATSFVAPVVIDIGKLFGLSTANDAALDTNFNAYDILVGSAFLANGTNALNIPNLQTGLSSVAVTSTGLKIIERPGPACDGGEAQTSQIDFDSTIKTTVTNSPLINLPGAQLRLVDASGNNSNDINLTLDAAIAGARGRLTNISCNPDTFDVDVWSDLASVSLTGGSGLAGDVYVTLLGVASVKVPIKAQIAVSASTQQPASGPAHAQVKIPPGTYDTPVSVGAGEPTLPHVTVSVVPGSVQVIGNVTVSVLGLPVTVPTGDVLAAVMPVLNPVVAALGSTTGRIGSVVNPLIDKLNSVISKLSIGLGLNLGGADVYGVPTPNCQTPVLRG